MLSMCFHLLLMYTGPASIDGSVKQGVRPSGSHGAPHCDRHAQSYKYLVYSKCIKSVC